MSRQLAGVDARKIERGPDERGLVGPVGFVILSERHEEEPEPEIALDGELESDRGLLHFQLRLAFQTHLKHEVELLAEIPREKKPAPEVLETALARAALRLALDELEGKVAPRLGLSLQRERPREERRIER